MFLLKLLFILTSSYAEIQSFSVSGVSDYDTSETVDSDSGYYYIYAGMVDGTDVAITSLCTSDPCDTCKGDFSENAGNPNIDSNQGGSTTPHVCNKKALRVSTASMTLSFGSSSHSGRLRLTVNDDSGTSLCESATTITAGNSTSFTCEWDSDICNNSEFGNSDCLSFGDKTATFRLGVDTGDDGKLDSADDYIRVKISIRHADNANLSASVTSSATCATFAGICTYKIFPGDEKVYFLNNSSDLTVTSGFPVVTGEIRYKAVRVYYEELAASGNACSTVQTNFGFGSTQYADFTIADSSTFSISSDSIIDGLTNDTGYCFRTAVVDTTGFVSAFTDVSEIGLSDHKAIPENVVGLIEEGNCFIATAAYGSPLDNRIDILRNLRDRVLKKFTLGKAFIDFYYANSKPLAIWIAHHPVAKWITQILLLPIIALSYLILHPIYLSMVVAAGIGLLFISRRRI